MEERSIPELIGDRWTDVANLTKEQFEFKYDAHLMAKLYKPNGWEKTASPLIQLMFGPNSSEKKWADNYASKVYKKMKNYEYFINNYITIK